MKNMLIIIVCAAAASIVVTLITKSLGVEIHQSLVALLVA